MRDKDMTVREYARKWRVTQRTVRNWIDKDAILVKRTPTGRIRIPVESDGQFVVFDTTNHKSSP